MPLDERDAALPHDMPSAARLAIMYAQGRTREDLDRDTMLSDAVVRRIQIIGEAVRGISESCQAAHPDIDWSAIRATRNILVHEYRRVNHNIVWRILQEHLPPLVAQIEQILQQNPPPPIQH